MGYHISSVLSIQSNDTHSFFAYFIPSKRLEYKWVNDWVDKHFLEIAQSFGPKGVLVAPTPLYTVSYTKEIEEYLGVDDRYYRQMDESLRYEDMVHYSGYPLIVFTRSPIQNHSERDKAIILNLAGCKSEQTLGKVLDVLIATGIKDDWEEIRNLPDLSVDIADKYHFEEAAEIKQNVYDATINRNRFRDHLCILFLAADPTDASRLRLGEESREIQEKLRLAELRAHFHFTQQTSVRPADISQALVDHRYRPTIVHFSGHGTEEGALCFENQLGEAHLVQPDALAALFEQFEKTVSCVVLNACYSEIQAKAIANHIDYVIGMNQAIDDRAAIAFSVGFYQSLGAGLTIEESFKLGVVQIRLQNLPDHLTPVLFKGGQLIS